MNEVRSPQGCVSVDTSVANKPGTSVSEPKENRQRMSGLLILGEFARISEVFFFVRLKQQFRCKLKIQTSSHDRCKVDFSTTRRRLRAQI